MQASSTLGGHVLNLAVDESINTYRSAAVASPGEYFQTDLGSECTVRAAQINYADQNVSANFLGRQPGLYHPYELYHSLNGNTW